MSLFNIFSKKKTSTKELIQDLNNLTTKLEELSGTLTNQHTALKDLQLDEIPERIKDTLSLLGKEQEKLQKVENGIEELRTIKSGGEEFNKQLNNITINLGSSNAVIEMKLQDANNAIKAVNQYYHDHIDPLQAIDNLTKQIPSLKNELNNLKKKVQEIHINTEA